MWIAYYYDLIDASMVWSHACAFVSTYKLVFVRLFARIVKIKSIVPNYEIILIMLVDLAEIVCLQL